MGTNQKTIETAVLKNWDKKKVLLIKKKVFLLKMEIYIQDGTQLKA